MHIKRVKITDIRRFGSGKQALELELPVEGKGWVVLAGTNGSGKTTALQCIAHTLMQGPPQDVFWQTAEWIRRGSSRGTTKLVVERSAEDLWTQEADDFSGKHPDELVEIADQWSTTHGAHTHGREADKNRAFNGPWSAGARGWLSVGYGSQRRIVGHGDGATAWMASEAKNAAFVTLFRSDASLVHSIRWLMDLHYRSIDDARSKIEKASAARTLDGVLKLLDHELLLNMKVEGVSSKGLAVKTNDGTYDVLELSSGVQVVVALVVDLLRQVHLRFGRVDVANGSGPPRVERSGVVLIDEPELHLHVSWQQKIGFWLKAHFPNIQFIVATHSPFVCQAADPKGLVRLFPPGAPKAAAIADDQLYRTVVNGAVDEAVLSKLFGMEHTHSDQSEALREELSVLEAKELEGKKLTARQRKRADELRTLLPVSGLQRSDVLRRAAEKLL